MRRDPLLLVPYLAVGLLFATLDWMRRRDPLPTLEFEPLRVDGGISISVEFVGYPTGIPHTSALLESFVGLRFGYLAWGIVSYLLPLLAVAVASAYVLHRAIGAELLNLGSGMGTWVGSILPLFGFVLAMDLFQRLLGSIALLQDMGLLGLVPLALYFLVMIRLFVVPGLLVLGYAPREALRVSNRLTRGRGWLLFGVVLVLGLAAWLLASVPLPSAGPVLSTTLVAPVHALAIVVVLERSNAAG
ncbi:hypothetical protein [Halobiforma nitratireducens]|uniref:Uncharacterized protein n=1 Tax=Halobiforma nitratireducens JCM 10879 TaxID=1227454 RepID=M0MD53_9EURY|nr:hypothetical protein [Halobiforma nitratireducens]EMA43666.1 hypothetical protein C446_03244 [Halobiforma nitratireducens JCM 10879]